MPAPRFRLAHGMTALVVKVSEEVLVGIKGESEFRAPLS